MHPSDLYFTKPFGFLFEVFFEMNLDFEEIDNLRDSDADTELCISESLLSELRAF